MFVYSNLIIVKLKLLYKLSQLEVSEMFQSRSVDNTNNKVTDIQAALA